jgi:hypothetical protein
MPGERSTRLAGVRLGVQTLAEAAVAGGGGLLAIGSSQVKPRRPPPSRMAAEAARVAKGSEAVGSAALAGLVRLLAARPPRGRAARALAVALPMFAGRRFQLAGFVASGGAPSRLVDALDAQVSAAGYAGASLAAHDDLGLVRWLSAMAEAEVDVDQEMAALAAVEDLK